MWKRLAVTNALAYKTEGLITAINLGEASSDKCIGFTVVQCYLLV